MLCWPPQKTCEEPQLWRLANSHKSNLSHDLGQKVCWLAGSLVRVAVIGLIIYQIVLPQPRISQTPGVVPEFNSSKIKCWNHGAHFVRQTLACSETLSRLKQRKKLPSPQSADLIAPRKWSWTLLGAACWKLCSKDQTASLSHLGHSEPKTFKLATSYL